MTVTRLDNTVDLPLGSYWKAKPDAEAAAGQLVILEEVRDVRGEPHSVDVLKHPSLWKKVDTRRDDNHYYNLTRRYMLDDFLDQYEPDDAGEEQKAQELRDAQDRVTTAMRQLAPPPAPKQKLLAAGGVTAARNTAQALAKYSHDTNAQLEAVQTAMGPVKRLLHEQALVAKIKAGAVQTHLKKVQAQLLTIGLYTGDSVDVVKLAKGDPAPPGELLHLYQRLLYLDEESLINAAYGGADFQSLPTFRKLLRADDTVLNRIAPAQRCVVAMQFRRRQREYGDPLLNAFLNSRNKRAFLLIRNGGNVNAVFSDIELMHRLFPTSNEFEEQFVDRPYSFRGIDARTITPEDLDYPDAVNKADDLATYYKRILVLLAGLYDRETGVLGDFAGGHVNLFDPAVQAHHFRFVFDDEKVLDDGRPAFYDFANAKNAKIRSGSRVACFWRNLLTPETAPGCHSRHYTNQELCFRPEGPAAILQARKRGDGFQVKVPVSGWAPWGMNERQFTARVTLPEGSENGRWYKDNWYGGLSHLCVDEVTADDLAYYMDNRRERQRYLELAPALGAIHRLLSA